MFSNTFRQVVKQSSIARRQYSAAPQAFQVFDRKVKCMQKDRAASNVEESRTVDYLKDEIAARVADRLLVKSRFEQTRKKLRTYKTLPRILNEISIQWSTWAQVADILSSTQQKI